VGDPFRADSAVTQRIDAIREQKPFKKGMELTCDVPVVDGRAEQQAIRLHQFLQHRIKTVFDRAFAVTRPADALTGKAAAAAVEVDVKDLYIMYNKKIPLNIECVFSVALEVMGGKWKPYIIYELVGGPRRPSQLQKAIPEACNRILTQQLRELLQYCVVERKVVDPVCKHSEYSLTPLGKSLIPIIDQMREWGNNFRPRLEEILKEKNE
jgi:DNA-binding HxlR family transcriptional regulator